LLRLRFDFLQIKTRGSESRDQEGTKRTPNQKNVTTTVSHLHDGMVSLFTKITYDMSYFKICMTKSQTHERIHPSFHRHKTFVLVLYTVQSFGTVYAIAC